MGAIRRGAAFENSSGDASRARVDDSTKQALVQLADSDGTKHATENPVPVRIHTNDGDDNPVPWYYGPQGAYPGVEILPPVDPLQVELQSELPAGTQKIGKTDVGLFEKWNRDAFAAESDEIEVTDTVALVLAENQYRAEALLQNVGENDIYLGGTSSTTPTNYYVKLGAGKSFLDDRTFQAWYVIAATGETSRLHVFELPYTSDL